MEMKKTFYGFIVKNFWDEDIRVCKLFSRENCEYDILFKGEVLAKISKEKNSNQDATIRLIYSRDRSIAEIELAELAIKVLDEIGKN